jgi:hypothetical protein
MSLLSFVAAVPIGAVLAVFATPRLVEYVETIEIKGTKKQIFDAIRFQEKLMLWSAWPSETGSACKVEGRDGEMGARTVFTDKQGRPFGYQEIKTLVDGQSVGFILRSKGPPHKPELYFHLADIDADRTRVLLHFP